MLKLSDGSDILVRPHTKLILKQPETSGWKYFQIMIGRVRTSIQKHLGGTPAFQIGTPSAVISVRGTKFDVEVDRRGFTEVDVDEGVVELEGVSGRGESVMITAGFSSRVEAKAARKRRGQPAICAHSLTVRASRTGSQAMITIPSANCWPRTTIGTMTTAEATMAVILPPALTAAILPAEALTAVITDRARLPVRMEAHPVPMIVIVQEAAITTVAVQNRLIWPESSGLHPRV